MISLGIDIGGSSTKFALVGLNSEVLWESRSDRYTRPQRDELLETLSRAVSSCPHDLSTIQHVGLCAPGLLNERRDAIAAAVNVPGLVGTPFVHIVRQALNKSGASDTPAPPADPRLTVVTDAHAAAFDVWRTTRLPGRYVCLSMGTGVGASVLDEGEPLKISGASPGHLGQVDVSLDDDAPIGPDGGRGSLEAYAGLPALRSRYGAGVESALASMTIDQPPARALIRILRICHAIYRPQHIWLVGGVGIRLAPLIPALRDAVADRLTSVARSGWTLSSGVTEYHAARGAAVMARQ